MDVTMGAAEIDITPGPDLQPIDLTGFIARTNPSTGVRDPLFVRAVAWEQAGAVAVLCAVDCLGLAAEVEAAIAERVAARTGVPPHALLLHCTHTHSAPAALELIGCGRMAPRWVDLLVEAVAQAVHDALARREPASGRVGRARLPANFNRRHPERPVPDEVWAGWWETRSQRVALCAYTCHPVVLGPENRRISADYPGAFYRAVRRELGEDTIPIFLNGPAGDVNPRERGSEAMCDALGEALYGAFARALGEASPWPSGPVRAAASRIALPVDEGDLDLAARRRLADAPPASSSARDRAMQEWAQRSLAALAAHGPVPVEAHLRAVRVGGVRLLGLPGEPLSALGPAIRARCGDPLVLGYCQASCGYVAPAEEYPVGGYEVEEAYRFYGLPVRLHPQAADLLVDAACRLLEDLEEETAST